MHDSAQMAAQFSPSAWHRPTVVPTLADESEVHVWRIPLDLDEDRTDGLRRHLSPDETSRAARFVFAEHRTRFVVAHGALRTILAAGTGRAPRDLAFRVGSHGKPSLERDDIDPAKEKATRVGYA